jgi:hypothetical protein
MRKKRKKTEFRDHHQADVAEFFFGLLLQRFLIENEISVLLEIEIKECALTCSGLLKRMDSSKVGEHKISVDSNCFII